MPKKSRYYFCDTKLCAKHKKTRELHLHCCNHVCKVNEWCLVDYFHREFRVSTQIMVRDYCIAECKKLSACSGHLIALLAIFFAIENFYVDSKTLNNLPAIFQFYALL